MKKRAYRKGIKRIHNGKDRLTGRPYEAKKKTRKFVGNKTTEEKTIVVEEACCKSEKDFQTINQKVVSEIFKFGFKEWNNELGIWYTVAPSWILRKYRKHIDHVMDFVRRQGLRIKT